MFSWGSGSWDTPYDAAKWMTIGLKKLSKADEIIGHNILGFDIPALQKVYPEWTFKGTATDTMVLTRLLWPDIKGKDAKLIKKGTLPGNLLGRHSLEAFGYRLGRWKGDYAKIMKAAGIDPWANWNDKMQEYCEQDVEVTHALWDACQARAEAFSQRSIDLEHAVASIIIRQQNRGFAFNEKEAEALYTDLVGRQAELDTELRKTLGSWEVRTPFTPKANNKKFGYERGIPTHKVKVIEFNPSSRHHIANRLKALHGWKPTEFTPSGEPKVDDTILSQLQYPEAQLIAEYLMVGKRIGMLRDGKQGLLRKVRNGRIHGRVNPNGAVTGRMSHSNPNINIPTNDAPYGKRCRSLFRAGEGYVLVGADADALELCCLAGYMARYDGGAYIKTVLEGDKTNGTDIHSVNARALRLDPKAYYKVDGRDVTGRDIAKTWFYAFIYGAGDSKLKAILGKAQAKALGGSGRKQFLKNLSALGKLVEAVKTKAQKYGALRGLDGRRLYVRHLHAALNTLLQGAGAVIMKEALVILDKKLQAGGLVPGKDYEFVANVHDEWQIETRAGFARGVGQCATAAIKEAGESFNFECPISGSYKIGETWAETH
jgi:DNA polymerase I-like protein with 3'-5' exonuclease and polymerase domains